MRAHAFKALLLAACAAGCATQPVSNIDTFAARSASNSFEVFKRSVDSSGLVLNVQHDRQTTAASCGAHALASVVNYWRGPNTVTGDALFKQKPPSDLKSGYSLAELTDLAKAEGLQVSAVRLGEKEITSELEAGRPVLVPVRMPSIYVDTRTMPGQNVPVVGFARNFIVNRAGQISELTKVALVSHYVLVVGYQKDRFVVVEPVAGYRTISFDRLERYRKPFGDAALVFSANMRAAKIAAAQQ